MKSYHQRSSWNRREHTLAAQGAPAVPLTAHWRWVTSQGRVVADWAELTVETVTSGGQLVDVYVDVPISSPLTDTPGDYTLLIVLDKDTNTEWPVQVHYRLTRLPGR
jgi:hypothetical protein